MQYKMKNPRVDYSAGKEIPNKSFSEIPECFALATADAKSF